MSGHVRRIELRIKVEVLANGRGCGACRFVALNDAGWVCGAWRATQLFSDLQNEPLRHEICLAAETGHPTPPTRDQ